MALGVASPADGGHGERGAATATVAGRLLLGIRLRCHNHAPKKLTINLTFQKQAADEFGANTSAGRTKKAWGSERRVFMATGVA